MKSRKTMPGNIFRVSNRRPSAAFHRWRHCYGATFSAAIKLSKVEPKWVNTPFASLVSMSISIK